MFWGCIVTCFSSLAFATCQASITGAEHLRTNRCNQDAVAIAETPAGLLLAVADGCSGGRYSEWGARTAASWLHHNASRLLETSAGAEHLIESELLAALKTITSSVTGSDETGSGFVHDHLLFTLLIAFVGESHTTVVGAGDGCYAVNGLLVELDERNCPNYLGYGLLEEIPAKRLNLLSRIPTSEVQSLLLATDGALELERHQPVETPGLAEFWTADRYLNNPTLMQKRLNQVAARTRIFDDTSMAMCRRRLA